MRLVCLARLSPFSAQSLTRARHVVRCGRVLTSLQRPSQALANRGNVSSADVGRETQAMIPTRDVAVGRRSQFRALKRPRRRNRDKIGWAVQQPVDHPQPLPSCGQREYLAGQLVILLLEYPENNEIHIRLGGWSMNLQMSRNEHINRKCILRGAIDGDLLFFEKNERCAPFIRGFHNAWPEQPRTTYL